MNTVIAVIAGHPITLLQLICAESIGTIASFVALLALGVFDRTHD